MREFEWNGRCPPVRYYAPAGSWSGTFAAASFPSDRLSEIGRFDYPTRSLIWEWFADPGGASVGVARIIFTQAENSDLSTFHTELERAGVNTVRGSESIFDRSFSPFGMSSQQGSWNSQPAVWYWNPVNLIAASYAQLAAL